MRKNSNSVSKLFSNSEEFYKSVEQEYDLDYTPSHKAYLEKISKHTLTIAIGPAGTGKTLFAVKAALDMLKKHQTNQVVLLRPPIEMKGMAMGYLPGSIEEKNEAWLAPFFGVMEELEHKSTISKYLDEGKIITPAIPYVRGMTFRDSVVLIDEAQNLGAENLLTLLTRIGKDAKCIVTGDLKQIDVKLRDSGLHETINRLHKLKSVAIHEFTSEDIKRSGFAKDVVEMFEAEKEAIEEFNFKLKY